MRPQGLLPSECSRFDVANAYAAYADWWNVGGLTARCRAKGRSIREQLHRMEFVCRGEYFTPDDCGTVQIYLALVRRWEGEEAYVQEGNVIA